MMVFHDRIPRRRPKRHGRVYREAPRADFRHALRFWTGWSFEVRYGPSPRMQEGRDIFGPNQVWLNNFGVPVDQVSQQLQEASLAQAVTWGAVGKGSGLQPNGPRPHRLGRLPTRDGFTSGRPFPPTSPRASANAAKPTKLDSTEALGQLAFGRKSKSSAYDLEGPFNILLV